MKKPHLIALLFAVFSAGFWALPAYFQQSEAAQRWTLEARDLLFKIRHAADAPETPKGVAIVAIDDESCEELGVRWPWPRHLIAQLIDELSERGAAVIGLNLSFTGLEEGVDASTRELADAMKRHGRVVIGATFDRQNRYLRPSPLLAEAAAAYGYLEKIVDEDFLIRRSYLLRPYALSAGVFSEQGMSGSDLFESSFPLAVLTKADGGHAAHFDPSEASLALTGLKKTGLANDGSYPINYLYKESDFTLIPAWKVVRGKVSSAELSGKTVFVGLSSSLFSDRHPTPLGIMPGIVIHANEFLALRSGRQLNFISERFSFIFAWLLACLLLFLSLSRQFWIGLVAFVLLFFGLLFTSQLFFQKDLVFEPFILFLAPVLGTVAGTAANLLFLLDETKGLETKVIHDKMTNLYAYDYLRLRLDDEWKRCQKLRLPVSVAMVDMDRFKRINDTLGHETGNQMILRAAAVIKESVRGYDVLARYGGDEFVVLLWHSNLDQAKAYRQRLRALYEKMAAKLEEPLLRESSLSIGVASFEPAIDPPAPRSPQELIEEADKDLFLDKESRRGTGASGR